MLNLSLNLNHISQLIIYHIIYCAFSIFSNSSDRTLTIKILVNIPQKSWMCTSQKMKTCDYAFQAQLAYVYLI
jgi:hypothetical protein